MPSVKRDIAPITGIEAGRTILRDLAQWAYNVNEGHPADSERKTTQDLSDMLYGLKTNDDVYVYNEYRMIQETLHQWWNSCDKVNREARIEWLQLAREFEFISLAAAHEDAMLSLFKPKKYLANELLTQRYADLEQYAHLNEAHCAAIHVLSEELGMPELVSLQRPLSAFRRKDAALLIELTIERLNASPLPGAMELANFIAGLPEPGTSNSIDTNVTRRAKAAMKQKKPLLTRLNNALSIFLGTAQ